MKKIVFPLIVLTLTFTLACNDAGKKDSTEVAEEKNEQKLDSAGAKKMEDDHEFVVEAASGGLMEVQLGEIADQNAASAKVKEFAGTMVKDHSKANEELKALGAQKNISIPSTPGEDHQKHIDDLMTKKGDEFDKDYMKLMVEDHEEDVEKFEKEAEKGKAAEIKAFAAKQVPTLKQHLEMAKSIKNRLKQ